MDAGVDRPTTLVLGLGSPLRGDDGVGGEVVRALAARNLPATVEVVDGGTQGLGIVSLLEGRERLILVDAAEIGQRPGQWLRFTLGEARLLGPEPPGGDESLSVHSAGLRDALLLADALHWLPAEVVVYGVQPACLDWDSRLSVEVQTAIPHIVERIGNELGL